MATDHLPPVDKIPTLPTIERARILDMLFEPCVALHTLSVPLLHEKAFGSYDDLNASVGVQLTDLAESSSTSDTTWLLEILSAHPRLGEQRVDSAQSRAEQAQLNAGGEKEAEKLRALNAQYEKLFGFRYVYVCLLRGYGGGLELLLIASLARVFVDGRGRAEILEDMQSRIERGEMEAEIAAAIKVSLGRSVSSRESSMTFGRLCVISLHPVPESCFRHTQSMTKTTNKDGGSRSYRTSIDKR